MPNFQRTLKTRAKRALHALFGFGQRLGVDVLPRHFYSQIPDIAKLGASTAWRQPMSLSGVQGADLDHQSMFLNDTVPPATVMAVAGCNVHDEAVRANGSDGGYGPIEADFLYAFIRTWKPKRVVQVGCGVSTAVILQAAADEGHILEVVCLDPYPTAYLMALAKQGRITLIPQPAQDVDISELTSLQAGDLLFIDSTHAVRAGSEVNRIVLEALPRLPKGVFVHFHDIYFPYDYPRRLLTEDLFFHAESTLVHAFLACNSRYEIQASLSMLHYASPHLLKARFSRYDPQGNLDGLAAEGGRHFPSALWLRTVG